MTGDDLNQGTTDLSVILRHPVMVASEIEELFGLAASYMHSVGDLRRSGKAYEETRCGFRLPSSATGDSEQTLATAAKWLDDRSEVLASFTSNHGSVDIYLTVNATSRVVVSLQPEMTARIAAHHARVDVEIVRID